MYRTLVLKNERASDAAGWHRELSDEMPVTASGHLTPTDDWLGLYGFPTIDNVTRRTMDNEDDVSDVSESVTDVDLRLTVVLVRSNKILIGQSTPICHQVQKVR